MRCIPRTGTLHPPAIEIGGSGAHDLNLSNRIDFPDFPGCWEFSFLLDDMACKCDSWTCLWGSEDGTQPKNKTDREADSRHCEDILTPPPLGSNLTGPFQLLHPINALYCLCQYGLTFCFLHPKSPLQTYFLYQSGLGFCWFVCLWFFWPILTFITAFLNRCYCSSHLRDEEVEAQRSEGTCPKYEPGNVLCSFHDLPFLIQLRASKKDSLNHHQTAVIIVPRKTKLLMSKLEDA